MAKVAETATRARVKVAVKVPEGCDRLCVAAANNEAEQLRKTLAFILPVTILCIKFYVFFNP